MTEKFTTNPILQIGIVGRSPEITHVADEAFLASWSNYPVLITGESGVGKGLLARSIHAASGRKGGFVVANMGEFDDHLFADTLYGHRKGAFSGADQYRNGLVKSAAKGTLFLDEIGDLSLRNQLKLLRLIDEGEFLPLGADKPEKAEVGFVLATNQNLPKSIREGKFRLDLYHRINTHHIQIPPLRERRDDIPMLVDHFVDEICKCFEKPKPRVSPETRKMFAAYDFPGNVRELRSLLVNAMIRIPPSESPPVLRIDLPTPCEVVRPDESENETVETTGPIEDKPVVFAERLPTLKEVEELLIDETLRRCGGVQTAAAVRLGISQQALSQRLRKKRLQNV